MYKLYKYYIIIAQLLSLFVFNNLVFAQQFTKDLLNLEQQNSSFVKAYNQLKLKDAWQFLDSRVINFTTTTIGIIDSGIDGLGDRHPEFHTVNLGNTPNEALFDRDSLGHGTQVAGIIGANNISLSSPSNYIFPQMNGIVSGVKNLNYITEVRFDGGKNLFKFLEDIFSLSFSGAKVINMSTGFKINNPPCAINASVLAITSLLKPAILSMGTIFNTLFIVAAGEPTFNIGDVECSMPANLGNNLANVITVGAVDSFDNRSNFSRFGDAVNISAPGIGVYAPAPRGKGSFPTSSVATSSLRNYDLDFSGTSAAAPLVTGVAAILKALEPEYQKFNPGLIMNPAKIKEILIKSADPIITDQPLGQDCFNFNPIIYTGCRENAHRAVAWFFPPTPAGLSLTTSTAILPAVSSRSSLVLPQSANEIFSVFQHSLGTVEGIGTHFKIKDSKYLNINIASAEEIKLRAESAPEMITIIFQPISSATNTEITISGLASSTTYYKYEDDYHNFVLFITNTDGSFNYVQDISKPHLVFIQPRKSTKFIKDDTIGGDCSLLGIWDNVTKTCFLNRDFDEFTAETIQIDSDGITLDGDGHIFDPNQGSTLIFSNKNGVTIKNLVIRNVGFGIMFFNSSGSIIENNSIFNNFSAAIRLISSNSNKINNNLAVSGPGLGISSFTKSVNNKYSKNIINGMFMDDNNSVISDNIIGPSAFALLLANGASGNSIFNNTFSGTIFGIRLDQDVDNNIIFNNNFLSSGQNAINLGKGNIFNLNKPIGGNHWIDFDEPIERCFDFNKDEFCDAPYLNILGGGQDNLPWIKIDGWRKRIDANLLWTKNEDPDFISYKIFRSLEPNVDPNDTLLATIVNQNQISFTDINLDSNQSFHYRIFVIDGAGLKSGSNEVNVK